MNIDKHFTATTYIIHQNQPLTLLHFHKKLQTWLPPGGHMEENETPKESAVREITEETAILPEHLHFIQNGEPPRQLDQRAEILAMPHFLLSEEIEEGHYHLDWIFYAIVDPKNFDHSARKTEFRWFSVEDLRETENIFTNVRELALKGLEFYATDNINE